MQSGERGQYIRRQEVEMVVRCFKCGKERHQYRECPKRKVKKKTSREESGAYGYAIRGTAKRVEKKSSARCEA